MLKISLRVFALLLTAIALNISFAQSDDGTLLSPNMPLPSPLNLLPVITKPQPIPSPTSQQPATPVQASPQPAPAAAPSVSRPMAPASSTTPTTSSSPVSAPQPAPQASKPVDAPAGLIMPITVSPSTNIAKPVTSTPAPVAAKPAPKPAAAKPAPVAAKPAPKPAAAKPAPVAAKPAPKPAAAKPKPVPVVRTSSRALLVITAKSTAYNSHVSQTDSTPFITATGARTRFGVVALSRDLLRRIPYGSIVRIEDLGNWSNGRGRGTYNRMLAGVNFIVEDTMHPRKRNTVDVWMPNRSAAIRWGARQIRVTVIRLGRR